MVYHTLITGAASGIGLALTKKFAANGHNLVLVDINQTALLDVYREIKNTFPNLRVLCLVIDLSRPNAGFRIFESLDEEGIIIDILINNAGFGMVEEIFEESDPEKRSKMIDVNIKAPQDLTHYFVENFFKKTRNTRGRILFVSSTSAFQPIIHLPSYAASKTFILHLAESLRYQYKKTWISISILAPGPTTSNFWNQEETKISLDSKLFHFLLKPTTPEEVANAAYIGLMKGKKEIIPGWRNWIMAQLSKLDGHHLLSTRIAYWLQSTPQKKSRHHPQLRIYKESNDSSN